MLENYPKSITKITIQWDGKIVSDKVYLVSSLKKLAENWKHEINFLHRYNNYILTHWK